MPPPLKRSNVGIRHDASVPESPRAPLHATLEPPDDLARGDPLSRPRAQLIFVPEPGDPAALGTQLEPARLALQLSLVSARAGHEEAQVPHPPDQPRQGLEQELEQFGPVDSPVEEPREVPPGAGDALGKPHGDRVAAYADADDRNRLGRGLGGPSARYASGQDNVNFELDQFLCEPAKIRLALGRSHLENEILPLEIVDLGQAAAQC